ncbi:MAG TPA: histidinol dehydrogenase [Clostridiales bacterium]|nr:histidinol dehydrogenase [Clostridiales bacterium]
MKFIKQAKPRNVEEDRQLTQKVAEIIYNVRKRGDEALFDYNMKFDQCNRQQFLVSKEEIEEAYAEVTEREIADMKAAAANIRNFAEAQKACILPLENYQTSSNVYLGHRIIPVSSCCCYVPGGSYPLYSTALMLIIPAKVAGVKRVAACSPCMKGSNKINPKTLVAMDIAGADEIYALGGAHGIAAFSYGTEQIYPVDLIVGPGNQYVAEAKRQCYGQVGIDFVAGPSEVLVIADDTANPQIIAADILAQSEHDYLAKGILITTDEKVAYDTINAMENQLRTLPTADIAARSWSDYGEVILVSDLEEAVDLANQYAPEHLELMVKNPKDVVPKLINYGSLFIGEATAEVFGDYASGTNHTLPTLKAARYTGGLWVGTFLKICTHQYMDYSAIKRMVPLVSNMARGEGLIAHARAAEIRQELFSQQE